MKHDYGSKAAVAVAVLTLAPAAQAHLLGARGAEFAAGFVHPFSGLDHLLAMVAIGLWAAQLGGHARWIVPLAFISAMAAGAGLALAGIRVPAVETGIDSSVVVLGLLIAAAVRLPTAVSAFLVGAFAIFHGHAHGAELPQAVSEALYGVGFLLATALLHATGLIAGTLCRFFLSPRSLQLAGGAIVGVAAALWVLV